MRIFITGGSGLLGQYLNIELSKKHQILTQYNSNTGNCKIYNNLRLDLTDESGLERVFNDFKPEIVIHTAAIADQKIVQSVEPKLVYLVNVLVTEKISLLCEKYKAKLIYTSTDLVYAGYRGSMLKEEAKLIPASLYAETKLMGEKKICQSFDDYIILRTALLYGLALNHSKCHFDLLYNNLKRGKETKLFSDQYRTPISLKEAARLIEGIILKDIKSEIFNFGGLERVSRFELGERLCEIKGFDKNLLIKISMDDVPDLTLVSDVSLNVSKLRSVGLNPMSISESIEELYID